MKTSLRHIGGKPDSDAALVDNLGPALDRAMAIADLLHAVEVEDATVMDVTRQHAAWAIILEMDEARAQLDTWHKAKVKEARKEAKVRAEAEKKRLEDPKERIRDSLDFILAGEFPDPVERAAEIERRFAREEAREAAEKEVPNG